MTHQRATPEPLTALSSRPQSWATARAHVRHGAEALRGQCGSEAAEAFDAALTDTEAAPRQEMP